MFLKRGLSSILLIILASLCVRAQSAIQTLGGTNHDGLWVVASGGENNLRITALAIIQRIRLELFDQIGERIYDSDFQSGSTIGLDVHKQNIQISQNGYYSCLVTLEDLAGQVRRRSGTFQLKNGQITFDRNKMSISSNFPAETAGNDAINVSDEMSAPLALLAHDGTDGLVVTGKGGLIFQLGDLSANGAEKMRLTADGRLGIGVKDPQAKLDVSGLIRTAEGIMFPDGTIQKTALVNGVALFDRTSSGKQLTKIGNGTVARLAVEGPTNSIYGTNAGFSNTSGYYNAFFGIDAGYSNTTGFENSFFGRRAGWSNTTGSDNAFFGAFAGGENTTGSDNAFFGIGAGQANTRGSGNSFFGPGAGINNTFGAYNSFFGDGAGGSNTMGNLNSFFGVGAGNANTTGDSNSFFGPYAGQNNATGNSNSFFGDSAGMHNTTGDANAFFGQNAGFSNTTGFYNSFVGRGAGKFNTTGNDNSFFGDSAGMNNTAGGSNAFFGQAAGLANTTGNGNAFFGMSAGASNTTGEPNSFFGANAGAANTTGANNSFFGFAAGANNTTGEANSFIGATAGGSNTIGSDNVFFGLGAGQSNDTGNANSFFGMESGWANTTGNYNAFFGLAAGISNTTEDGNSFIGGLSNGVESITNATALGYQAQVTQSNSLVLGSINGVNGASSDVNVGIGTASPDRQLTVEGDQAIGRFRRFYGTSAVYAPALLMERTRGTRDAQEDIIAGDYLGKVQFRGLVDGNMPDYGLFAFIAGDTNQNGRFSFIDRDLVTERVSILNTGNMGIGTTNPTERLEVAGNLKVSGSIFYGASGSIPDYVFEPNYKLMPIKKLGNYLKSERHLPNVPSASEIKQKDVNLSEFQMKLLEKIEELTLYIVNQDKKIDSQKKAIDRKDAEIAAMKSVLETRITELERVLKTEAHR